MIDINIVINQLIDYVQKNQLIDPFDVPWTINNLLSFLKLHVFALHFVYSDCRRSADNGGYHR